MTVTAARADSSTDRVLREIEERVLWLATAIVDHANRVRPNPAGLEVGGHQASSVDGDDHDLPVVGAAAGRGPGPATWILDAAFPAERAAPMVTVLDGHPHTPAFLAGVRGVLRHTWASRDSGRAATWTACTGTTAWTPAP